MCSCVQRKKIVYFNTSNSTLSNINYFPILQNDDLLAITVTCLDLQSAIPFNLPATNIVNSNAGYQTGSPAPQGYLIGTNGTIDFPEVGQIKLAGLSRAEAIKLIKNKLKDYIKNPIVNIRILNFKITLLGDVKNPGTYTIPNERISVLEAIGLSGDLNITAKRTNLLIIRDSVGKKIEKRIDLTSKELFSSPYYYLNQNDVLYIEPNRVKINSGAVNSANASVIVSVTTLLITMLVYILKR